MLTYYIKHDLYDAFNPINDPIEGCWIHADEATPQDLAKIAQLIDLDYGDIHDSLDKFEIPRIERFKECVIIYTRYPSNGEQGLHTAPLTIILSKHYFITISPFKSSLIQQIALQKPKLTSSHSAKLLLHLLLRMTQEYTVEIKKIRASVLKKEKSIQEVDSEDITMLTQHEETLNQFLSSLITMRNVFEAIASGKYTLLYEKDQSLLDDLLNASIQSEDICTINLRSIRSLRDSYQIIFTNQLNKTIKLLTALTIILNIPTMVASLYGMNLRLPLAGVDGAFYYIFAIILVSSVVVFYIFQRKRWL